MSREKRILTKIDWYFDWLLVGRRKLVFFWTCIFLEEPGLLMNFMGLSVVVGLCFVGQI